MIIIIIIIIRAFDVTKYSPIKLPVNKINPDLFFSFLSLFSDLMVFMTRAVHTPYIAKR